MARFTPSVFTLADELLALCEQPGRGDAVDALAVTMLALCGGDPSIAREALKAAAVEVKEVDLPGHAIEVVPSPASYLVRCSCGWSYRERTKEKRLARRAKIRARVREHRGEK